MIKRYIFVLVAMLVYPGYSFPQTVPLDARRIQTLEAQLLATQDSLGRLQETVDALASEQIRGNVAAAEWELTEEVSEEDGEDPLKQLSEAERQALFN